MSPTMRICYELVTSTIERLPEFNNFKQAGSLDNLLFVATDVVVLKFHQACIATKPLWSSVTHSSPVGVTQLNATSKTTEVIAVDESRGDMRCWMHCSGSITGVENRLWHRNSKLMAPTSR